MKRKKKKKDKKQNKETVTDQRKGTAKMNRVLHDNDCAGEIIIKFMAKHKNPSLHERTGPTHTPTSL